MIDYRLAQLSPLALSLAGLAGVIGRRFALALVVAASGQPEAEVICRAWTSFPSGGLCKKWRVASMTLATTNCARWPTAS